MKTYIDIDKIDKWRRFILKEVMDLREKSAPWAQRKSDTLAELSEFLRKIREEHQMRTIGDKPIEG